MTKVYIIDHVSDLCVLYTEPRQRRLPGIFHPPLSLHLCGVSVSVYFAFLIIFSLFYTTFSSIHQSSL
jgi:hypothetical protein